MRIEPFLKLPRRGGQEIDESSALVPGDGNRIPQIILPSMKGGTEDEPSTELAELASSYDVRYITPREMVDLSRALYMSSQIDREQFNALAFQSELMPNFDHTIGALTGERAEPDRPRNYIQVWRKRLEFETTYYPDDDRIVDRTRKILDLLDSMKPVEGRRSLNPLARARRPSQTSPNRDN